MLRDAWLICRKDLRIEIRSHVVSNQVLPFSFVVLILFAFAFNEYPQLLTKIAPGLYWVATLFAMIIAAQRSASIEMTNMTKSALAIYDISPGGVYLGKLLAVVIQMILLELVLAFEIVVLYGATLHAIPLLGATCIAATVGIAGVTTIVGAMISNSQRETLLPLLVLPVVAPVLLSATVAWQDYLNSKIGAGNPWLGLLVVFAVVFCGVGTLVFGTVLEE